MKYKKENKSNTTKNSTKKSKIKAEKVEVFDDVNIEKDIDKYFSKTNEFKRKLKFLIEDIDIFVRIVISKLQSFKLVIETKIRIIKHKTSSRKYDKLIREHKKKLEHSRIDKVKEDSFLKIKDSLNKFVFNVKETMANILQSLKSIGKSTSIKIRNINENVSTWFKKLGKDITNTASNVSSKIQHSKETLIANIKETYEKLKANLKESNEKNYSRIKEFADKKIDSIQRFVNKRLTDIKVFIQKIAFKLDGNDVVTSIPDQKKNAEIKSNNENTRKFAKKSLIVIGVCFVVFVVGNFVISAIKNSNSNTNNNEIAEETEKETVEYADNKYRSLFIQSYKKAYNPDDFVGQIVFESEIINEPVLQAKDNDYYLRRDYTTNKYAIAGPVFVDYACDIYMDNNTVLYGHDFPKADDPEQKLFFTPLHLLRDKDNYEENKTIYFVLRDRVETYVVCYVYDVGIVQNEDGDQYLMDGEPIYYTNNYSKEELQEYLNSVENKKMYETENTISLDDKLLTLQTYYESSFDKLIVLAKRIDTKYFENPINTK